MTNTSDMFYARKQLDAAVSALLEGNAPLRQRFAYAGKEMVILHAAGSYLPESIRDQFNEFIEPINEGTIEATVRTLTDTQLRAAAHKILGFYIEILKHSPAHE